MMLPTAREAFGLPAKVATSLYVKVLPFAMLATIWSTFFAKGECIISENSLPHLAYLVNLACGHDYCRVRSVSYVNKRILGQIGISGDCFITDGWGDGRGVSAYDLQIQSSGFGDDGVYECGRVGARGGIYVAGFYL